MTPEPKDPSATKWQAYFMIAAGLFLLASRFVNPDQEWSTVDWLKSGIAIALIVFGLGKLVKKAKPNI